MREQRKLKKRAGHPQIDKELKGSQRKLVAALSLLIAFCATIGIALGGKLWIHAPIWLIIIGWLGAAAMGIIGFFLWVKNKSSFNFEGSWVLKFAVAFLLGVTSSYAYSQMIREVGEAVQIQKIKKENSALIEMTQSWDGSSWKGDNCKKFESLLKKLDADVLGGEIPPTGVSYRLLLAVIQVGYQAGCEINFDTHIQALLDKDGKWKKAAPWQYNTLRIWVNQTGWPRIETGCRWEARRAMVDGNEELATEIQSSCNPTRLGKLEAWDPGRITQISAMKVKAKEDGNRQLEEAVNSIKKHEDQ